MSFNINDEIFGFWYVLPYNHRTQGDVMDQDGEVLVNVPIDLAGEITNTHDHLVELMVAAQEKGATLNRFIPVKHIGYLKMLKETRVD